MIRFRKIIKFRIIDIILAVILGSLTNCTDNGSDSATIHEPDNSKIEIRLNASIAIRASETTFEEQDKIGLYVVNQDNHQQMGLQPHGNHVDNMCFTYSDLWTPNESIYWKDDTTKADFYCYYPYRTTPDSHTCLFSTRVNQTTEENYKASMFLWGKTCGISPTKIAVNVTTRHLFSCAEIKLIPGRGFTEESLKDAEIKVRINHVLPDAAINLSNGRVTACGNPSSIQPWFDGFCYKAIVVPQSIDKNDLVVINVNGKDYILTQGHTFEANRCHTFTATINKANNGLNVGIGKWEDDPIDHGGNAE